MAFASEAITHSVTKPANDAEQTTSGTIWHEPITVALNQSKIVCRVSLSQMSILANENQTKNRDIYRSARSNENGRFDEILLMMR